MDGLRETAWAPVRWRARCVQVAKKDKNIWSVSGIVWAAAQGQSVPCAGHTWMLCPVLALTLRCWRRSEGEWSWGRVWKTFSEEGLTKLGVSSLEKRRLRGSLCPCTSLKWGCSRGWYLLPCLMWEEGTVRLRFDIWKFFLTKLVVRHKLPREVSLEVSRRSLDMAPGMWAGGDDGAGLGAALMTLDLLQPW